jgi:hypothetical protein
MNHQEIFEAWKRHKEQIEASRDFSGKVMARIRESQVVRETPGRALTSCLGRWAARPWAKAAMIAIGVSLGLVRIVMTLHLVLFA